MTQYDRPVVQIIGDGVQGHWLTWRWGDPGFGCGVHQAKGLGEALTQFHAALPEGDPKNPADLRLRGPLTREGDELELMIRLAAALLPTALAEQMLAQDRRFDVRVMPSPITARVPWGLLPVGDKRLIELADVSWMGPILPRDIAASPQPAPNTAGRGPLYVIDPPVRGKCRVVSPDFFLPGMQEAGARIQKSVFDANGFACHLAQGASRLYLLGHAKEWATRPGETHFLISETRLGAGIVLGEDHSSPPRVAIVACASGVDLADSEPLGLATAFLIRGADTVQGTLWPLPTDHGLSQTDAAASGAFTELATAIDKALPSDAPVAALCAYQRRRLGAWRANPVLRNSPVLWGAAMTMTAPRGRHLALEQSAGAFAAQGGG